MRLVCQHNLLIAQILLLLGHAGTIRAEETSSLAQALLHQAPRILEQLRERDCHRIGVLKFRVSKAGDRVTDRAGELNLRLARQLQSSLVLKNSRQSHKQIAMARDASAVAASIEAATHLTPEGRSALFAGHYPAAWGDEVLELDAFLTGVVQIDPDLRTMRVGILIVQRDEPALELIVPPFVVEVDATLLSELGESFQLPDRSFHLRAGGELDEVHPAELALAVRDDPQAQFPLTDEPAVMLRVLYDGRPVDLEFVDGQAMIPEPAAGQRIALELERLDNSEIALGAVLKVNGENTLYRQRLRDYDCRKWALLPSDGSGRPGMPGVPLRLEGFQLENGQAEMFQVVSRDKSNELAIDYGADVGTISLVVFAASTPSADDSTVVQRARMLLPPDLAAVERAEFPAQNPADVESLQQEMRLLASKSTRGLITHGDVFDHNIDLLAIEFAPQPVISVVIRYYRPER